MSINVMVVDDSIFIRVLIKDILESATQEEIRVISMVSNGIDALKEIRNNPNIDVVTLDVRMPEKDGLQTLKEMMKIRKVPVVMISSYTSFGAKQTIEALSHGAVDVIMKSNDENAKELYDIKSEIIGKVIAAYHSKPMIKSNIHNENSSGINHIVGIGSSTGGPKALKTLISSIPSEFSSPLLVSQHMPEGEFMRLLAEKLNDNTFYTVKVVENGEEVKLRTIYLCPGGFNMEVFKRGKKLHLVLSRKTESKIYYVPNVDLLFSSISRLDKNIKKTVVVLTGMGDDGAKGSLAVYREGGTVIAESEKTAVVYGMPKKVSELPIQTHIADIDKIIKYIIKK